MEVKNCRDCGRLFNYMSGLRLCSACKQKLEDKFVEVRTFVRDNPSTSIASVSEEMEVTVQQIHQWIREERLVFSADSLVTIDCESCGAQIRTGRLCDKCKNNMIHGLDNLYKREEPKIQKKERERERMRFLDDIDK